MKTMSLSRWVAAASLMLSAAAMAQTAYTNTNVNVRAGPGQDYPLVATISPGVAIAVQGCVSDYQWCDIIVGESRGWVYARSIDTAYQNRTVPVYGYGPQVGFPILSFSVGSYWDNYYRDRPFYGDRGRWNDHPGYGYRPSPGRPAWQPPRNDWNDNRPGRPDWNDNRPGRPDWNDNRVGRPDWNHNNRPDRPNFTDNRPGRPDWNNGGNGRPDVRPPGNNGGNGRPDVRPPGNPGGGRPDGGGGRPGGGGQRGNPNQGVIDQHLEAPRQP